MTRTTAEREPTDPADLSVDSEAQADRVVDAAMAEIQDLGKLETPELEKRISALKGLQENRVVGGRIDAVFAKGEMLLMGGIYHRSERRIGELQTKGNYEAAERTREHVPVFKSRIDTWGRVLKGETTDQDQELVVETITRYRELAEIRDSRNDLPEAPTDTPNTPEPDRNERPGRRPEDRYDFRSRDTDDILERARHQRERAERDRSDRGYRAR